MPCSDCTPSFSALNKLEECQLLSRARFNQAAVPSERTELAKLISHAERDLTDCGKAIAKLQEIIIALTKEQRNLNRQVCLAKSLMAPIRQLPPELLRQIFIAYGSTNIIRSDKSAICHIPGLKVASICSHWRSIAVDTPALWNDISVEIRDDTEYDSRLPLTERLLALSQKSLLSISIDVESATESVTSTIPMFVLLCAQANRWQRLEGSLERDPYEASQPIVDALASMQGHLDSLHTFQLFGSFKDCSRWVEGVPKLHTLSIRHLDDRSATIPWNQIVDLEAKESRVLRIAESLRKMPNLLSLDVTYFHCKPNEVHNDETKKVVSHSNLESLRITITDNEDEEEMETLFDSLTLPQLQSLCIYVENEYLTSQDDQTWSSVKLPSLISRSPALITSLSLDSVWMDTSDLISLLRIMPALTSLLLSEPSDNDGSDMLPMINDRLLSSMYYHQDDQSILTHLTSLNLEVSPRASFSIPMFVEMIHSRWKPAYLDDDEVTCIEAVRLYVWDSEIALNTVYSLTLLQKRGLDVTIEDATEKAVISGNRSWSWS